jgi:hypothetical protein
VDDPAGQEGLISKGLLRRLRPELGSFPQPKGDWRIQRAGVGCDVGSTYCVLLFEPTIEPVSVSTGNSRRERVRRGQRLGRAFGRPLSIPRDRDWELSRLPCQSLGKLKTIPNAPGNGICGIWKVGFATPKVASMRAECYRRSSAARPRSSSPARLRTSASHQCPGDPRQQRYGVQAHGIVRESAVTVKSPDPFPAIIAARVCGGVNASGVRSRMCRSTFPSRSAISANDRHRLSEAGVKPLQAAMIKSHGRERWKKSTD